MPRRGVDTSCSASCCAYVTGIGTQAVIPHNITLIIGDAHLCLITATCLLEVVVVDEIIAGVVRRIDIDHLDLAVIRLVQDLQRRQVVALDKHIARRIPIDGIRPVGMECLDSLLLDGSEDVALALPAKPVALTQINRLTQSRLELLPVDFTFGDYLGEKLSQFVNLLLMYVVVVAFHTKNTSCIWLIIQDKGVYRWFVMVYFLLLSKYNFVLV